MAVLHQIEPDRTVHPCDTIEHIATINDWNFERQDDDEISISVRGAWSDYRVSFNWMEDLRVAAYRLRLRPQGARHAARRGEHLIALINEQSDQAFRHVEPRGRGPVPQFAPADRRSGSDAAAVEAFAPLGDDCDLYYQAFQFVVWAGKNAGDALSQVMFETVGEA